MLSAYGIHALCLALFGENHAACPVDAPCSQGDRTPALPGSVTLNAGCRDGTEWLTWDHGVDSQRSSPNRGGLVYRDIFLATNRTFQTEGLSWDSPAVTSSMIFLGTTTV